MIQDTMGNFKCEKNQGFLALKYDDLLWRRNMDAWKTFEDYTDK